MRCRNHSVCFMCACARSDKPGTQSIHRGAVHQILALGHPSSGIRFGENCKTTMPFSSWCILIDEEPHTMNTLPLISHVLLVHDQGLTRLGHDQYTSIMFIQATEHPSCGIRFGENCKTTKPSLGWYILLGEEPHAMYVLPPIPHVLWVHDQGLTSLGHDQYTSILIIQAT